MAKKLITKGVNSSVLVKNLNAEYIKGLNLNEIQEFSAANYQKNLICIDDYRIKTNSLYSLHIWGNSYVAGKYLPVDTYVQFGVIAGDISDLNTPPMLYHIGVLHNGYNFGDIKFFVYDNKIYLYYEIGFNPNLYVICYKDGDVRNTIKSIANKDIPEEGVYFLKTLTSTASAKNNTGKAFDIVDLPSNISKLDLSTLPPIANVSTIILRYNGVVQDLDTYISQVEEPVIPLPMSDEVKVNADMPSTLELEPGIAPMINLDEYVTDSPYGFLRIYVPHTYIYEYKKRYPKLSAYFFKLRGRIPYDITIGGTNLLLNTKTFANHTLYENNKIVPGYDDFSAINIDMSFITPEPGQEKYNLFRSLNVKLEYNTYYTFSFYGKGDKVVFLTNNVNFCVNHNDGTNILENGGNILFQTIQMSSEWKRYYITYLTQPSPDGSLTFETSMSMRAYAPSNIFICGFKLEKGFIATDWSPAPQDIDEQFEGTNSEIEEIKETYAKKDGAYEGLLAGTAMNLQGQQDVTISSMYQPTGGNLDVNWETAEIQNIKGNAVAWNQLLNHPNNNSNSFYIFYYTPTNQKFPLNHIYYIACTYTTDSEFDPTAKPIQMGLGSTGSFWGQNKNITLLPDKKDKYISVVSKNEYETNHTVHIIYGNSETTNNGHISFSNLMLINLTLIYGEGNEPTTPEQFEEDYLRWFGKRLTYEEYDEGSIRNVKATGLKTVGFNLYDGEDLSGTVGSLTQKILFTNNCNYKGQICVSYKLSSEVLPERKVIATTNKNKIVKNIKITYDLSGYSFLLAVNYYDNTNEFIGAIGNAYREGIIVNLKDICVNFVWSGSRDGDYEEHWEETYSLPITTVKGKLNGEGESVVVFSDGLKRVGNVYDEIKVEDGVTKAIKRIEKIILSDLIWDYDTRNDLNRFEGVLPKKSLSYNIENINALSPKYLSNVKPISVYKEGNDNGIVCGTNLIFIRDTRYTEVESFKSFIQDLPCYYVLEEPEVYILDDDFKLPLVYRIDDFGTEQFFSPDKAITPILTTRYGVNAVDTLRRLPRNYVSERSINNLLYQLNSVMNGTWTKSWNDITNSYDFSFIPNEVPDSSLLNEKLP